MGHVVHMNKRTEIQKVVDMGTRKFVTSTIVHFSKIVGPNNTSKKSAT